MKKRTILIFSLLLGFSLILTGCAATPARMYQGPARPPEEVAIVKVDPALWRFSLDDYKEPEGIVELLPGRHTFVVCLADYWSQSGEIRKMGEQVSWPRGDQLTIWERRQSTEPVTLEFEAVASHQYWIGFNLWMVGKDCSKKPYRGLLSLFQPGHLECEFQVFDCTTKAIVARTKTLVKES